MIDAYGQTDRRVESPRVDILNTKMRNLLSINSMNIRTKTHVQFFLS